MIKYIIASLMWMWTVLTALGRTLLKSEMPVWLSLLLASAAALGTYVLAPVLNEKFELQKTQSQHVLTTVQSLNAAMVSLTVAVRGYNSDLFYQKKELDKSRGEVLDKITELQWRLIDAEAIINRTARSSAPLAKLSETLELLQLATVEARDPEDQERLIAAFDKVSDAAKSALASLYSAARLTGHQSGEATDGVRANGA